MYVEARRNLIQTKTQFNGANKEASGVGQGQSVYVYKFVAHTTNTQAEYFESDLLTTNYVDI